MEETLKPEVGDILVCCDVDKDFEDEYCIFLGYDEIGDAIIYSFDLAEVEIFSRKFYVIEDESEDDWEFSFYTTPNKDRPWWWEYAF